MLFKIAFVLWIAWLLGIVGVYRMGDLIHIFFLIGGLFFLLAVAKLEMPPPPVSEPLSARTDRDARTFRTVPL